MQPAAAPCMTGAVNFKTMKLSMSACCMHAATSLNLQEWVCPLDGWTPWTDSTSPPPTSAPWTQELNLSCEMMFLFQYSRWTLRTLLTSSKPPTRRRRQGRYAGESDHPQRRKLPIPGIPNFQDNPRSFTCQQSTGCLKCCTCWPFITCYNPVSFATLGG